jgi:hypothetical protein
VQVDREKVKKLGVPVNDVFTTFQTFLGGYQINDFTRFGRNYKVTMQAESQFRQEITNLSQLFVRNDQGDMVPLDTLTTASPSTGARFLQRFNLYRTAAFSGSQSPAASSGDAIKALGASRPRSCRGLRLRWTGQSRQEIEAGNASTVVLGLSIVVVFLFLAALYELGRAVRGTARDAVWIPRCTDRAQAERHPVQRLRPDRPGHADRTLRQECDPDRPVRGSKRERPTARRGGTRGRQAAIAAHSHDVAGIHSRCRSRSRSRPALARPRKSRSASRCWAACSRRRS